MKFFRKQLFLTVFIIGFLFFTNGKNIPINGNDKIKELLQNISVQKDDTIKVKLLNDLAFTYCKISPYDGIKYAEQSVKLAEKLHWEMGIARGKSCLGANYFSLSNYPNAYKYWLAALEINEKIDNKIGVANHQHNIGNVFFSQKNYPLALEYYEKALHNSKLIGNDKIMTNSYTAIGNVYTQLKEYQKALDYNLQALAIDEKNNNKSNIATDKINIGAVYNYQKKYDKALEELFFGLKIKKEIGDKYASANAYNLIGNVYLNMAKTNTNAIPQANNYLDSAVVIDNAIGNLDNLQKTYQALADVKLLQHDYKSALETYKQYTIIKDSIFSLGKENEIFNLQKKAEIEEKNREQEKELEAKEQLEYVEMGAVCIFIMLLIFAVLLLSKRKVNPSLIEFLSTLSVLTFFELVNLLVHTKVEKLTNHNLILTLLCLIAIASIIIPLHHKIEHWLKERVAHD
ncbi:MAG: hypothetical protein RJA07_246 [Bacteroidota bacterium]|jgi:tetratricopeptide (TPR) repeat protein